jgi:uncharacterized membrane protein
LQHFFDKDIMARVAQFGIALGALGIVLTLMGLFPGVTGVNATPAIGIVQISAILVGFSLLIFGALIYVKFTFYVNIPSTLAQQISTRLAMTGLLFAALTGLADIFGFGSHTRALAVDAFIGPLQAVGVIGSFLLAAFGVLLYAMMGPSDEN